MHAALHILDRKTDICNTKLKYTLLFLFLFYKLTGTGQRYIMRFIFKKKTGNSMSLPELRKVSRNIGKSYLADYIKMNKWSCHYIIKLEASQ